MSSRSSMFGFFELFDAVGNDETQPWTDYAIEFGASKGDTSAISHDQLIDAIRRAGIVKKFINIKGTKTELSFNAITIGFNNDAAKSGLLVRASKSDKLLKNPDKIQVVFTHPAAAVNCYFEFVDHYGLNHLQINVYANLLEQAPVVRRGVTKKQLEKETAAFQSKQLDTPIIFEFDMPPRDK